MGAKHAYIYGSFLGEYPSHLCTSGTWLHSMVLP